MYLLKPTPMVEKVFCYCLAHAARVYNIQIHAYCVMSNHYHMVVTDPEGRLPAFMSWFNEFVAKALNCVWDRWENFWSPPPYSAVRLETSDDVVDKIIYTLTNPVKSLLVSDSGRWPGVTSRTKAYGLPQIFRRPKIFFKKNGVMPPESSLTLTVPGSFEGTAAKFKTLINQLIRDKESEFKQLSRSSGHCFLGQAALKAVRHDERPISSAPRRNLNPHVASKNRKSLQNALKRLKQFRTEYAAAKMKFINGETNVVFPFGTYGLQKIVAIEPIPPHLVMPN